MDRQDSLATLSDHVVICNCNGNVGKIVEELHIADTVEPIAVVLVVQNGELWQQNPRWHPRRHDPDHYFEIAGSPADEAVLEAAHIDRARAAVVLADPCQGSLADARTTLVALAIEQKAPAVHTVVELLRPGNRVHLMATEVDEVVCVSEVKEKLIAQSCVTPWVKNVFRHILASAQETAQMSLTRLPEALHGSSFRELSRRAILAEANFILAGFIRARPGATRGEVDIVISPPAGVALGKDTVLGAGDQLVLIARGVPELERYLGAGAD